MTFKILTSNKNKIIYRSAVRSAETPDKNYGAEMGRKQENIPVIPDRNITAPDSDDGENSDYIDTTPPPDGETKDSTESSYNESTHQPKVITSRYDHTEDDVEMPPMPIMNPKDLVGRTFLLHQEEDGQKFRARIIEAVNAHEDKVQQHPELLKFKYSINNDQFEEIMAYNDIVHHIYVDQESDVVWQYKDIISHEGPLNQNHPNYKGSRYNVKVRWENDEITSEPLKIIAADDPVTLAQYALDNDLLNTNGWRRFRIIAKNQKKLKRMANQAKLRSYRYAPKYMFGFEVSRNYNHALELD